MDWLQHVQNNQILSQTMKNRVVTDGELAKLTRKYADLVRRLGQGTLPPEETLLGMQNLVEGNHAFVPMKNRNSCLPKWRNLQIGGMKLDTILEELKTQGIAVYQSALDLITSEHFSMDPKVSSVELIKLTLRDLGITDNLIGDSFDPKFLARWSEENLVGYTISLCPRPVALFLPKAYPNESIDEMRLIATEPFAVPVRGRRDTFMYYGFLNDYTVRPDMTKVGRLVADRVEHNQYVSPETQIVYQLNKLPSKAKKKGE